jgi:hypothetical protein
MNCDGVRDLLSAYLDGELSPGELLRVEQHLRRCHACADEVDSLRQTVALVASLEEVELPVGFHAQLHDRLVALGPPAAAVRRVGSATSRQRQARRWAVPAAAAAAVFAVGLTAYSTLSSPGTGMVATSHFTNNGPVAETTQQGNTAQNPTTSDPAKSGEIAQNTLPATGTGTTDIKPSGTTEQQGTKQNDTPFDPTVGQTAKNGGVGTATKDTTTTPPPAPAVIQYGALIAVAKDDAKIATLKSEYALSQPVNGGLMFTVPADSFETIVARVKELFPNAQVTSQNVDLGNDIAAADAKLTVLRAELDQLQKQTKLDLEEQARLKAEIKQAEDDRQLFVDQAKTATVTLTFQTAAQ